MSVNEFKQFARGHLGIEIVNLGDSIFDSKYHLTETDVIYLIYCLLSNSFIQKKELPTVLKLDDITFDFIFKMCNDL